MARVAIIGGSSFLHSPGFGALFRPLSVDTKHGRVALYVGTGAAASVYFVQRHQADPAHAYSPPHLINFAAIAAALKALGCARVLAAGSVGTLKPDTIPCGSLVVPNDYHSLALAVPGAAAPDPIHSQLATAAGHSKAGHLAPGFDAELRSALLAELRRGGFSPVDGGVYAQTTGPRFETPAEIRHLALFGDLVGMTCASEASVCKEAGLAYALFCMVDNICNGLATNFSVDDFHAGVRRNQETMDRLLVFLLRSEALVPAPAPQAGPAPREVDLVVTARYVVPLAAADAAAGTEPVLEHHAVVVHGGRIVDIVRKDEVWQRFVAAEHVDLDADHVLLPGLVNSHAHCGMTALRGFADDTPLMVWLADHIWPAEGRHLSPGFVRAGTELAVAEMIRGGVTAVCDMYWYPQVTAEVVSAAGFRASVGAPLIDFPTQFAPDFDGYLAEAEKVAAQWAGHPLVRVSLAPHAPYTVSDEHLSRTREAAARLGLRVQMHVHETRDEPEHSAVLKEGSPSTHRSDQRVRPVANLERLGLLGPEFLAVHMTHLTDDEVRAVARLGCSVAHCPHSNMKLASGACRTAELLAAGVNVALGTDSTASNNSLDLFAEMRTASFLAKLTTGNARALPARQVLRMATLHGARAIGLGDETGSLEAGKLADMTAVSLASLGSLPVYDPVSHLVFAVDRSQVSDVWVAGRRLLRDRQLTTIDEARVRREAAEWGARIAEAAAAAANATRTNSGVSSS